MNKTELAKYKEELTKRGYEERKTLDGVIMEKSLIDDNALGSKLVVAFKEFELANDIYCESIRMIVCRDFGDCHFHEDTNIGYSSIEEIEKVAMSYYKWVCKNIPLLPPIKMRNC